MGNLNENVPGIKEAGVAPNPDNLAHREGRRGNRGGHPRWTSRSETSGGGGVDEVWMLAVWPNRWTDDAGRESKVFVRAGGRVP